MKKEYYINSTDEALITSDPRKSHNTMSVILWPNAKPKY